MSELGFIGTGTIGSPMAMRLLDAGHQLQVFDVNVAATRPHEDKGASRAASIAALAAKCSTIFLSLPGPKQIEQVMLAADGVLAHAARGTTIVDLSTNAIALNRRIAASAAARGLHYLDAPVSGGRVGAIGGKLAVMVGGERAAFEAVREFIACFGENIFYLGAAGAGTLTKLINNQIFLAASVLVQEGFVLGAKAGMDPATVLDVLKVSSAGSVVGRAGMFLSRKFDADIFALSIASKDIDVALASAQDLGVEMPMTSAAASVYHRAVEAGLGKEDFYATLKVLEGAADTQVPVLSKPGSVKSCPPLPSPLPQGGEGTRKERRVRSSYPLAPLGERAGGEGVNLPHNIPAQLTYRPRQACAAHKPLRPCAVPPRR